MITFFFFGGDGGGELCFLSAPSSVINDTLEEILSFDVKRCGIGVLFSLRPILVSGKQLTRANEFIGVGLNVSWEKIIFRYFYRMSR